MKKVLNIILLMLMPFVALAQMPEKPRHHVYIMVEGEIYDIKPEQTQTEIKPGWKIVDYETAPKTVRYLYGSMATDLGNVMQTLVIDPHDYVLSDFALVKMVKKSVYRRLKKAKILDNEYMVFDPNNFEIKPYDDDKFKCTPLHPLKPGEYAIVCLKAPQKGDAGDYELFPISIK